MLEPIASTIETLSQTDVPPLLDDATLGLDCLVPLFIEPLLGSGERLCVGVVGLHGGKALGLVAAGATRLEILYGPVARHMLKATQAALESLVCLLEKDGTSALGSWRPSHPGVHLGPVLPCLADNLEDALHQTLMRYSSLHG